MLSNQTLAVVGCGKEPKPVASLLKKKEKLKVIIGNMGSAILNGLLNATRSQSQPRVSNFVVVTGTAESADRLRSRFELDKSRLQVYHGDSLSAMKQADIIILGCKPFMAETILGQDGIGDALAGKFLISVLAGKTPQLLASYIQQTLLTAQKPFVVRAMPNVAARVRKSMTIIEHNPSLPDELSEALEWIFGQIGTVKVLESDLFDVGSLLVGSSMAILSIGLDGILDGCVSEGIRRPEALQMAAQSMLGMAEMLRQGEKPADYRESVSSPKGGTITALITVEKAGVRGTFAQSMKDGTKTVKG
ncbi:hypothetical protein NM208_g5241 [Fusarium decemcellulare]|uniref:Uncharacterized protein n=1 Tax=Fusarium decemcellulare TaxID=57161 RepID=A0ACC1SHK3_9HYPO|nr:hypothetical protein NM208_g5241 [Fusarium decemcellulare]